MSLTAHIGFVIRFVIRFGLDNTLLENGSYSVVGRDNPIHRLMTYVVLGSRPRAISLVVKMCRTVLDSAPSRNHPLNFLAERNKNKPLTG